MESYFSLLLSIVLFGLQFLFTKLYEKNISPGCTSPSGVFTFASSFFISTILFLFGNITFRNSPLALLLSVLFALFMMTINILQIKALSLGNAALVPLFIMGGNIIIPYLFGVFFLKEKSTLSNMFGVVLLIFSLCINVDFKQSQKKTEGLFFPLCFCCFLLNGLMGVIGKIQAQNAKEVSNIQFHFQAAIISMVLAAIYIVTGARTRSVKIILSKNRITKKQILAALFYAICNGGGNVFLLQSAGVLPSSLQFPVTSGGIILLSSLLLLIFYKQPISKRNGCSLLLTMVSLSFFIS